MLKRIEYIDLGRMDYGQCWDLQRSVFDAMLAAKTRGGRDATAEMRGRDARQGCGRDAAVAESRGRADLAVIGGGEAAESCNRELLLRRVDADECSDKAGTLFLVEHPPVYTLGKNGRTGNLLVGEERLHACGAEFYRTDRGGDITFHGEGQIVGYPILDLERIGIGLREYIAALEQSVIDTVAEYGIRAGRLEGASGVWLGEGAEFDDKAACGSTKGGDTAVGREAEAGNASENKYDAPTVAAGKTAAEKLPERASENAGTAENVAAERIPDTGKTAERASATGKALDNGALRKICAIGVRASRFITMHGFALNVSTDLHRFDVINPCGFTDKGATSMARELGYAPDMEEVKRKLTEHLSENLNVKIYKN